MQTRLTILVLFLVVLPTAVLSLVAGRALRDWEAILERRLERDARDTVQGIAARMDAALEEELAHVGALMTECLARGGDPGEIRHTAERLRTFRPMVRRAFLFMNPWGFVYPDAEERSGKGAGPKPSAVPGSDEASQGRYADLVGALRTAIALSDVQSGGLRLPWGDNGVFFGPLRGRKSLYAGFEASRDTVLAVLRKEVAAARGRGLVVEIHGPGVPEEPASLAGRGRVLISDSFTALGEVAVEGGAGEFPADRSGRRRLLANGSLRLPFDSLKLRAFVEDPAEVRRVGVLLSRLFGWGIILLTGGVVGGAWLVVRAASNEIRQAHARTDMVVGVSHDLRTPVASVKVLAESLCLDRVRDPARQREFLGTIVRECNRLSQLIERVIFFVRLGQGSLAYQRRSADAVALVHACVDAFRDRYDRVYATTDGSAAGEADGVGGVRCGIKVDVDPALVGGGPAVLIDEAAMTQVILNLLDNAVKYSGGVSGRPLRVDVSVGAVKCRMRIGSRSRRCVRISVRDYGIGIERRDRRRIFRPFYRSVSASRVNASGVGLGLALCRHVVVSHGGSIEVSSAVGAGSTFSVLLPLAGCSPAAGGTGSRASGEPVRPCGPHSGDPDERDGTDAGQEFVSGGAPRVNR